ncbi:hypothetical protein [Burkholderia gladioli]|uniref:hypothetical protein n=1 Tax=Burkholderia gladioli TaxID=28095 RepID=UPI00163FF83A|nr:hypothetical protein [Burkholderia gladioli]
MSDIRQKLINIVTANVGVGVGRKEEQPDLYELLANERHADKIVLYASTFGDLGSVLIHSVLVPSKSININEDSDFTEWSGNPYDGPGCGLVYGGGAPPRVEYHNGALADSGMLAEARRIVIGRSFEALRGGTAYYELAQELTLAHGLHWVDERSAWCRLDDCGDVEDVAKVEVVERPGSELRTTIVTADRELMNLHMAATDTCIFQMFDVDVRHNRFHLFDGGVEKVFTDAWNELALKYRIDDHRASYFRGGQILRPRFDAHGMGEVLYAAQNAPRQYASFITQDFKNAQIVDVSCDPASLASYFEPNSPLPFETSPVFFRPEVLDKYKADPDKYRINSRTIACRNSWHLQTYDFNEAGQVHTMITYLGNLPFAEQLYWKSFNEAPKSSISKRSLETDFQGTFASDRDPLQDLKGKLEAMSRESAPWFTLREPRLLEQLHYPLTSANKGWNEVIVNLAKCVTEGIEKKFIEAAARSRGSDGQPTWGSIKWLDELLRKLDVEDDRVREVCGPLFELQRLRSKLAGTHATGSEAIEIRRALLKAHKTPLKHIKSLATQLQNSLVSLSELLVAVDD